MSNPQKSRSRLKEWWEKRKQPTPEEQARQDISEMPVAELTKSLLGEDFMKDLENYRRTSQD